MTTPIPEHQRPDGVDDTTVEAVGRLTEALEMVEVARGHLYSFHRMLGHADFALDEVLKLLRKAGHDTVADRIESELLGRNVIEGRWTFQIAEEFDDTYWSFFREVERGAREELLGGRRHLYEAEFKESRRTPGEAHHEAIPDDSGPQGSGS
jgi:hypothetical protein